MYKGPKEMDRTDNFSDIDLSIMKRIDSYTMTSIERQIALIDAVRYLVRRGVQGCFVECGVWRGGSIMAAMLTLIDEGASDRNIFLYDTFKGMTPPTDVDVTFDGTPAAVHLKNDRHGTGYWCLASLDDVKSNLKVTGYPEDRVNYIQGPVEQTLPAFGPEEDIALLRLDTDWYESTKHELIHLFPKLCPGGVLIIDDYGYWQGARLAVDEYLSQVKKQYYMHRIDFTGRIMIKS